MHDDRYVFDAQMTLLNTISLHMLMLFKGFILALLLTPSLSHASNVYRSYWGVTPVYGISVADACDKWKELGESTNGYAIYLTFNAQGDGCSAYRTSTDAFVSSTVPALLDASCPAGSTDDGNGNCIEDNPCLPTQGQPISWLSATGTDGCVDGCTTGGVTACFNIPKIVNGVTTAEYHCSSDYSSTGTECTGGGDTETQPLIETCASGQIAGDFNGSFQCVDNTTGQVVDTSPTVTETATSNTTSNTVDNGDGTTTTTTTTTTTNADGSTSTTTTTQTKDSNGDVISSGTITDSELKDSDGDGTADGSGEGEGDGEDTESTFAASACGTAPACEGDAIQCAIATQQHEANCLITGDGSPITTESLLGAGEATTLEVDPSDQYDISGMLDTSSFVAGACPAPRTISVYGQNMTIDYTELCNLADILGYLVMFTASIISLRIIGGAF